MRRLLGFALVFVVLLAVGSLLNHGSSQVAFMGDSLTQGWSFPRANFGIRGQTTAQMLERFDRQIAGHGFRQVVILGGTNDTLQHVAPAETIANLDQMVALARRAGVEPLLAEIPPIYSDDGRYLAASATLDQQIMLLAQREHVQLVDYYDALLGHTDAYSDGTHMKLRGYLRMEWALLQVDRPF
jgi:lysophospholipase L1-like esterase